MKNNCWEVRWEPSVIVDEIANKSRYWKNQCKQFSFIINHFIPVHPKYWPPAPPLRILSLSPLPFASERVASHIILVLQDSEGLGTTSPSEARHGIPL